MKTLYSMLLVLCALTAYGEPSLPRVESNPSARTSFQSWKGKTLAEAIPPSTVKRIVLDGQSGYSGGRSLNTPLDYNALFSHLYAAKQPVREWGLKAQEMNVASFVVFTADGQVFSWRIVSADFGRTPSAVLIHGQTQSARIDVTGFAPAKAPK